MKKLLAAVTVLAVQYKQKRGDFRVMPNRLGMASCMHCRMVRRRRGYETTHSSCGLPPSGAAESSGGEGLAGVISLVRLVTHL